MLSHRTRTPELMDRPEVPTADLHRSLADLRNVNRWLGNTRALLDLVGPMIASVEERPVRVLDVATGSGDIPLALADWAARQGRSIAITATDVHEVALESARAHTAGCPEITVAAADALRLPFQDGEFQVAICCTALHHFDEDDAVRVLAELRRVSTHGLVVLDLRRSIPALLGAALLAATVWRSHPVTRHDGPASVRGAFTAWELEALARRAGIPDAVVRTHALIRLSLTAGPPATRR